MTKRNKATETKHKIAYKSNWPNVRKALRECSTPPRRLGYVSAINLVSALTTGDRHYFVDKCKNLPTVTGMNSPEELWIGTLDNNGIHTCVGCNTEVAIMGYNNSELVRDITNRVTEDGSSACRFKEVQPGEYHIMAPVSLIYSVCKQAVR